MTRLFPLAALAASLARAGDLMPLDMGNYWTYREDRTGETFTIRVGQPVWMQPGRVYHYLIGYTGGAVIARVDEAGNLMMLDEETGQEKLLTAFGETGESWWTAPKRECLQEGQTQAKRVAHDGPGGRWSGVREVRYRTLGCTDAGVEREEFAENLGMLRRTVTTLAGPRTFDLIHARIGTQIIETRDRARFSVAVEQPPSQDTLRVNLRIDLGFTPEIRLKFPSAQVFDAVLRDPAGRIVWRWSDGRFFEQAERERAIGNVWSETVNVPKPPGDGQGYTIEGWLTTAPGEPKFAATVPMPPPRIAPAGDRP